MSDSVIDVMEPVPGQPPKKPNGDLGVRTVSAVVMIAIAATAIWLGGLFFAGFVGMIAIGLLWEWIGLSNRFSHTTTSKFWWLCIGIVYVGMACVSLVFFRLNTSSLAPVLSIIVAVVATDTGAYFAGRAIGGPKIAPKISPSKTWAGLIGGMLAASVALFALSLTFDGVYGSQTPMPERIGLSALVGSVAAICAQVGDFLESWMKRRAGVKDSGKLIPGHGGLLDRLDGMIAVSAAVSFIALGIAVVR